MHLRLPAAMLAVCLIVAGQNSLSLEQLKNFLKSSVELKQPDKQVAAYLAHVKLTERLDDSTIEDMQGLGLGPHTVEVLKKLRDASTGLPQAKPEPPPPVYVPPPPPSAEEQARILDEVRDNALNYSRSLPDYICTQVTRREYDPTGMGHFHNADTLVIRLSYSQQKGEDYKLILQNNRVTNEDYKSLGGSTSSGEFGTMLRELFERSTHAEFQWARWARLRGHRVYVFSYRVPVAYSQFHIDWERKRDIVAGYRGEVFIDCENHMVTRLSADAEDIPASFPVQETRQLLDYDYIKISDREFLLPLRSEMKMRSEKLLTRNDTEYRMYRKFSAESELKFDSDVPAPLPEDKTKEQPAK